MNLHSFNQITQAASKFWKNELNRTNKLEKEISTKCGCHDSEPSLIEISSNKIQKYLFPQEEDTNLCEEF